MKKGLALCGGGAKGSYEAGCFKAFEKLGIKFNIVTGTSIGCLNAAMYCQHDLDKDYELWEKLDVGMIVKYGFNFDRYDILNGIKNNKNSISMVLNYVTNRGADIRPLKKLFKEYINPEKIVNSDITLGVFSAQYPSMKGNEVIANKLDPALIRDYILSSASCWPVFPVCKIGDKNYVDGGYNDNLPINFCLKLGATDVVAIDLNPNPTHPEYLNKTFVKYIRPTHFLGTFMQFSHEQIMKNMALGFLDTMKAYKQYQGYRYTLTFEMPSLPYTEFTSRIIEIYSYVSRNNIKNTKKNVTDKNIFDYLSEYTDSYNLTHKELFVRALEVFAETTGVEYFSVYSAQNLIDESIDKLLKHDLRKGLFKDLDKQKNYEKKRTYLEKKDKFDLLRYLYNDILKGNKLNITVLSMIYSTKMDVCVSYILLSYLFKNGYLRNE